MMKQAFLLLLTMVATDALANYQVTINLEREGEKPISVTELVDLEESKKFSSTETIQYVSSIETTSKWYHRLFGLEPKPVIKNSEIALGISGDISLEPYHEKDVVIFNFEGQLVEQFAFDSFEIEEGEKIQVPSVRTQHYKGSHVIYLNKASGCLSPFSPIDETKLSVCVESADQSSVL